MTAALSATIACCAPTTQPNFNSPDAYARIQAIVAAGRDGDQQAVPLLIDLLDDEDDAVRLYAILALERITDRRMGYSYSDPPWRRAQAVQRWRAWLEGDRGQNSGTACVSAKTEGQKTP